jgi:6-phosphogluconolactonase
MQLNQIKRALSATVLSGSCFLSAACGAGSGATTATPPEPVTPAYSASAKYAFVATSGGVIDTFSVSSDGTWTQLAAVQARAGQDGMSMALDPKDRFLYAASGLGTSAEVLMYSVSAMTGAVTPLSPETLPIAGGNPYGMAVDGAGKFVYVADTDTQTVTSLAINQTTGVLSPTPNPVVTAGKEPTGVTTEPTGKYAYVSNKGDGTIWQYLINQSTGDLTPNMPSSVEGGSGAFVGTFNPAGSFYYSPGQSSNVVTVLSANPATGVLSSLGNSGNITTGNGPTSVAISPNGEFAYVANRTDSTVSVFSVNGTTGLLTNLQNLAAGGISPNSLVVDPGGQLLYVACLGQSIVAIFGINADGTLKQVSSIPLSAGGMNIVLISR